MSIGKDFTKALDQIRSAELQAGEGEWQTRVQDGMVYTYRNGHLFSWMPEEAWRAIQRLEIEKKP